MSWCPGSRHKRTAKDRQGESFLPISLKTCPSFTWLRCVGPRDGEDMLYWWMMMMIMTCHSLLLLCISCVCSCSYLKTSFEKGRCCSLQEAFSYDVTGSSVAGGGCSISSDQTLSFMYADHGRGSFARLAAPTSDKRPNPLANNR